MYLLFDFVEKNQGEKWPHNVKRKKGKKYKWNGIQKVFFSFSSAYTSSCCLLILEIGKGIRSKDVKFGWQRKKVNSWRKVGAKAFKIEIIE